MDKKKIKEVMSYMGKRSLQTMTPSERSDRAKKASLSRLCFECKKMMKTRYLHRGYYYCENCNYKLSTD